MVFVYLDGSLLNQQVKLFCLCMEEGINISKIIWLASLGKDWLPLIYTTASPNYSPTIIYLAINACDARGTWISLYFSSLSRECLESICANKFFSDVRGRWKVTGCTGCSVCLGVGNVSADNQRARSVLLTREHNSAQILLSGTRTASCSQNFWFS